MKLISEEVQNAEYLVEEVNGKKKYKIKGIFLQSDLKNRNGRVYPKDILENEVSRYNREFINKKRAFGELGHPDGPTVNLERVSHMITSLKPDGKNFIGEAKIMDTPYGKIVKGLIDDKEWVWDNGRLVERDIEAWKQQIREARQRKLDETKLKVFKSFLGKL
jgi:hypothetical protein